MSYGIADLIREVWKSDPVLNAAIPVAEDATNALFEEGFGLQVPRIPYAILIDNGSSAQRNLGDHAFFEIRTFSVKIYTNDRQQSTSLAQRFRLVFANMQEKQTDEGDVLAARASGGQSSLLSNGTRVTMHTIQFSVAENRGPSRLRATIERR